jgi:uncharacterized membrane protein
MAKMQTSIVIARPNEEVFAFLNDIKNWPNWHSGMLEAEQTSEGPVAVGTTFRGKSQALGQLMEWSSEVTTYEPNRKIEQSLKSGPMLLTQILTFEPVEDGTRLTIIAEGQTGGLFKLAEPIMNRQMQKQMEENFTKLKDILEA